MKELDEVLDLYCSKFESIGPYRSIPPLKYLAMLKAALDRGSPVTQEEIGAAIRERFLEDPTAVA